MKIKEASRDATINKDLIFHSANRGFLREKFRVSTSSDRSIQTRVPPSRFVADEILVGQLRNDFEMKR